MWFVTWQYGYYFFLGKKVDAKLYAQTGSSSQTVPLLLRRHPYTEEMRLRDEKEFFPWPEWAMSAWRYLLDARASTSVIQRWWRRNIGHGLTTCCKWAMQFKCLPTSKNKREFFGSYPSSSSEVSTENPENSRSAQKHFTVQLQLRYYSALASLQSVLIEDGNGMVLQTIGNAVFVFTQLIH